MLAVAVGVVQPLPESLQVISTEANIPLGQVAEVFVLSVQRESLTYIITLGGVRSVVQAE